jgi:hypothetical protein
VQRVVHRRAASDADALRRAFQIVPVGGHGLVQYHGVVERGHESLLVIRVEGTHVFGGGLANVADVVAHASAGVDE